jgi:UDP-N-acetylglucosamine 2-epimerase (non-hydrolysing)
MIITPPGLFDFIKLEKNAKCVLTDSGTVQEECCIFNIANLTIRDVTERPETIECGSNMVSGSDPITIKKNVDIAISNKFNWDPPDEYKVENVSSKVLKIVNSFYL